MQEVEAGELKKILGKRIKFFRKRLGLSQTQLAELVNIEMKSLSRIESGHNYPQCENLVAIARALKVAPWQLYFNEGKLSKEAIPREVEGSLKRLGTDYIDLLIIHRYDYDTPVEETMEALHNVVKSGKVRAIGASAMYGYQFNKLQYVAEKNNWTKFVSMQNHYNLLYREDERELIPICKEGNVALTPYSPLAAGRLSRPTWNSDTLRSKTDVVAEGKYDSTKENDMEIVKRVAELADSKNATMTQIAFAWHFKKGVASPIIGATKAKYLEDAAGSFDVKLSDDDINYVKELVNELNKIYNN